MCSFYELSHFMSFLLHVLLFLHTGQKPLKMLKSTLLGIWEILLLVLRRNLKQDLSCLVLQEKLDIRMKLSLLNLWFLGVWKVIKGRKILYWLLRKYILVKLNTNTHIYTQRALFQEKNVVTSKSHILCMLSHISR